MKTLAAMLVLLALSSAAFADEEKGFYLGAGVGQANVQADDIDDVGAIVAELDANATSFKLFGGWRFSKNFAAELAYLDFGSPEEVLGGTQVETELSGVAPYAVGTIALGPVELFAKVGYLFYDLDVKAAGQKIGSVSGGQDDFIFGVGAGVVLFKHLQTQLEYEYVDTSKTLDSVDAVWLSAAWRF
jgi:OOP family OmpA-OmpF porin